MTPFSTADRAIRNILVTVFLTLAFAISGLAGTLDGAFGSGGKTTINVNPSWNDITRRVFILPSGKILVVGTASIFFAGHSNAGIMLVRYNSDGTLDSTFGTGGVVTPSAPSFTVADAVLQPDGKVVVSGGIGGDGFPYTLGLARFNTDGTRDNTFGTAGIVNLTLGTVTQVAAGVEILAGGKILTVSSVPQNGPGPTPSRIDLVRLNSDGTPDGTFGTAGVVHADASFDLDPQITDLELRPDGRVMARGRSFVAQFNTDGTYDTSFSGDGVAPDYYFQSGLRLFLQPDGKYFVYGTSNASGFRLVRYNADGTLDSAFGTNGAVTTNFLGSSGFGESYVEDVALTSGGQIIAAGFTNPSGWNTGNFAMARYSAGGSLLAKTALAFTSPARGKAIAIQPDGKIVVAGIANAEGDAAVGVARFSAITSDPVAVKKNYDYNGDGKDDLVTYRPGTGGGSSHWYSITTGWPWWTFGAEGDLITPGEYNGDGRSDLAVFRPSTGYWYIANSISNASTDFTAVQWGVAGDIPAASDFDGDGLQDIAVFRPGTGAWYILASSNGQASAYSWGANGDIPVPGDYDGDFKADVAVFRPSTGSWYILKSSDSQMLAYFFGATGDRPVAADYDGDNKTDVAVFRPSDGTWYRLNSSNGSFVAQPWGQSGDVPVPGDYDGDGKTDVGVYRGAGGQGNWYILRSSDSAVQSVPWGLSADTPVPGN